MLEPGTKFGYACDRRWDLQERTLQAKKIAKALEQNQVSNVGSKVIRELANLIGDSNVAVSLSMLHSLKLLMEQGMIQGNLGCASILEVPYSVSIHLSHIPRYDQLHHGIHTWHLCTVRLWTMHCGPLYS